MIDYVEELESRGLGCVPSGDTNVFVTCPFHAEEAGSCSVSIKTGGFHCFGCGVAGSFFKLIAEIDGMDIGSARLMLNDEIDIIGALNTISVGVFGGGAGVARRYITRASYLKKFRRLSGEFLDYARGRKLGLDVCRRFLLRCGTSGRWAGRLMMPLRRVDGKLVGFTGRAIHKNLYLKMRTYIAYGGAVNDILFGLYECLAHVREVRRLILVEGPIDAIYLQECGFPAVGRLGKNLLSAEQVRLLVEHVDTVILSYDGDKNGLAALEKEYVRLRKFLPVVPIRLPEDNDPNDLDRRVVHEIYSPYFKRGCKNNNV